MKRESKILNGDYSKKRVQDLPSSVLRCEMIMVQEIGDRADLADAISDLKSKVGPRGMILIAVKP